MIVQGALISWLLAAGTACLSMPDQNGSVGDTHGSDGTCSLVWGYVGRQLLYDFLDADNQCTDTARQAIRLVFHDCIPPGGCDGSVALSGECFHRPENARLIPLCSKLVEVHQRFKVGMADLINFAGSLGTRACTGGPWIPFYTGRKDNPNEAPKNHLPPPSIDAGPLIAVFGRRGFSANEVVALLGSHSAAKNASGTPLDSTVTRLDSTVYYSETRDKRAPATLHSDFSVAKDPATRDTWNRYSRNQPAWSSDFRLAYTKMALLDNDRTKLKDCSSFVISAFRNRPGSTNSIDSTDSTDSNHDAALAALGDLLGEPNVEASSPGEPASGDAAWATLGDFLEEPNVGASSPGEPASGEPALEDRNEPGLGGD